MTALTDNRDTRQLDGLDPVKSLTILDAEIIYAGGILAVDHADEAQMAANTEGLRVIGTAPKEVDNTDDGEVLKPAGDGAIRGIRRFENSSNYPIPRSAIGQIAYVEDDNIVAGYASNYVAAGLIHDVDDDGVWVDQRPEALRIAHEMRPPTRVAKTAAYTVTNAIAFGGRTYLACALSGGGALEATLPSAVAGMRVGVQRTSDTAGDDVTVQAATGDKIQASDGFTDAGKQIDNTVDAVSEILWFRAVTDTDWVIDSPYPKDVGSWVKNNT